MNKRPLTKALIEAIRAGFVPAWYGIHGVSHWIRVRNNGLLLAPQADFLFDRGFISFGNGRLLISPVADEKSLVKLGVDPDRPPEVGRFTRAQETFLEFHQTEIFRSADAT